MNPPLAYANIDELLGSSQWIRRLAHELLDDKELVDDILQETCIAALEKPPRDPARLKSWLNTVTRNFVKLYYRERYRRRARETLVTRERPDASKDIDQVELDEARSLVAATVLELAEPYRTTMIRLFYDGISAKELARQLDLPESTVRVRKRRALAQLREQLETPLEGRPAIAIGLMAWTLPSSLIDTLRRASPAAAAPASLVATSMRHAWLPATLLLVILLGAGLVAFPKWTPLATVDRDPSTREAAHPRAQLAAVTAHAPTEQDLKSIANEVPPPDAATPSLWASERDRVEILVVDAVSGAPVAGATIATREPNLRSERLARGRGAFDYTMQAFADLSIGATGETGHLRIARDIFQHRRLSVRAPGYREYREQQRYRALAPRAYRIALPRADEASVLVVDDRGRPIAADIELEGSSGDRPAIHSDANGDIRFAWCDRDYSITVQADGYCSKRELVTAPAMRITLAPGRPGTGWIRDRDGRPIGHARLEFACVGIWHGAGLVVESDTHGRFTTPTLPKDGALSIRVSDATHVAQQYDVKLPWQDDTTWTLQDGAFVNGTLTDREGRPIGGARATVFTNDHGLDRYPRDLPRALTGTDGEFTVGPVEPGTYTLLVEHPTLEDVEMNIGEVTRGSNASVHVELGIGRTITGRCIDPEGAPVAGVAVQLGPIFGDEVRGPVAISDTEGRFTIHGLPTVPPPARPFPRDDFRWQDHAPRPAEDGNTPLIAYVHGPHQLIADCDESVPFNGFLGSRNTCEVEDDESDIELIVARPHDQGAVLTSLEDADGKRIRAICNLIVVDPDASDTVSVTFGGTDGSPVLMADPGLLQGSLVGFWTREYGIAFRMIEQDPTASILHVELERAKRQRVLYRKKLRDGTTCALADRAIYLAPVAADAFCGLYVGRTNATGELLLPLIGSGLYDLCIADEDAVARMTAQKNTTRRPLFDAQALEALRSVARVSVRASIEKTFEVMETE